MCLDLQPYLHVQWLRFQHVIAYSLRKPISTNVWHSCMVCDGVQGDTEPTYVGAAVWRFFLPGENPFVEVSDSIVLTGDCKVCGTSPRMPW